MDVSRNTIDIQAAGQEVSFLTSRSGMPLLKSFIEELVYIDSTLPILPRLKAFAKVIATKPSKL